jgi:hypothetical protein
MIALWLFASSAAFGQTLPPHPSGWQLIYHTDFESGTSTDWTLTSNPNLIGSWSIVKDGTNSVFEGLNNATVELAQRPFADFLLRFRLRIQPNANLIVFFRRGGGACGREWVGLSEGPIGYSRTMACNGSTDFSQSGSGSSGVVAGNWSTVDLVAIGGSTNVYVNGTLQFAGSDPAPLVVGSLDFGSSSPAVDIDDVQIYGPPQDSVANQLVWDNTGGPPGGIGYDVRMRMDLPSRMYATDNFTGVNISDDNGMTWYTSNNGITARAGFSGDAIPIFTLTVDPHNPNNVWVGTRNARGVYKSADAGATWTVKTRGIVENNITFRGITIDPRTANLMYAAAEVPSLEYAGQNIMGLRFGESKGVVYRSTDGGENWAPIWRGDALARYVWVDPRNSNVIYVSTGFFDVEPANSDPVNMKPGGVGVLKTTDGGQTWTALNQTNGLMDLYIGTLAMNPQNPDVLLAGSSSPYPSTTGSGLFVTFNGGATWANGVFANGGSPGGAWSAVTFAPGDPNVAYAAGPCSFLRSADMGKTWTTMSGQCSGLSSQSYGPPGLRAGTPVALQVDPRNSNRMFQNNYTGGNFLSEDGGMTWTLASKGYTGPGRGGGERSDDSRTRLFRRAPGYVSQ